MGSSGSSARLKVTVTGRWAEWYTGLAQRGTQAGRAIRFRVVLFSTELQDAIARRRTLFFPPVNVNGEKVGWEGKGKGQRHSRAMVVPPSIMSHECDLSITETEVSSLPASLFAYCFHLA
jgi:hypothetical protein